MDDMNNITGLLCRHVYRIEIEYNRYHSYYADQVSPGYLSQLVPDSAPEKAEHWTEVMRDLDTVIMPGVTHWHHPQVQYSTVQYSTVQYSTI